MSGARADARDRTPAGAGERGRPQRDPGYEPGDATRPRSPRGMLITIIGALVTAGVATATLSPGRIGGAAPVTSTATATEGSCNVQVPNALVPSAPRRVAGLVTGFLSDEQALAITRNVEAEVGIKENPAYPPLKRAVVRLGSGNPPPWTMAVIPVFLSVKIGDTVLVDSRYRDPTLPCHFIPWVIESVLLHGDSHTKR